MMILPIKCGITFARPIDSNYNSRRVTDHNRSPISVSSNRIENKSRMINGTLRKFVVATKRNFKVAWTDLPQKDSATVDGFWGANSLKNFYNSTNGDFYMTLNYGDGTDEIVHVMFEDFSSKLSKRGIHVDHYDIDISLEEV